MAEKDRVLVIGGTRGVGLLIARLLHRQGYGVRVLARDPDAAASQFHPDVKIVAGDITKPDTLPPAVQGCANIIFTAGVHSGRFARESLVRDTDYRGVLNTLDAARQTRFGGRFVYLNSIGIATRSVAATLLNLIKRNTLVWRARVEDQIRASGIDYTIIRVGFLTNRPGGQRAIEVGQGALPLAPRHRIPRADAAEVFVAAMHHPRASGTTFEIVSSQGRAREPLDQLLDRLRPDPRA